MAESFRPTLGRERTPAGDSGPAHAYDNVNYRENPHHNDPVTQQHDRRRRNTDWRAALKELTLACDSRPASLSGQNGQTLGPSEYSKPESSKRPYETWDRANWSRNGDQRCGAGYFCWRRSLLKWTGSGKNLNYKLTHNCFAFLRPIV